MDFVLACSDDPARNIYSSLGNIPGFFSSAASKVHVKKGIRSPYHFKPPELLHWQISSCQDRDCTDRTTDMSGYVTANDSPPVKFNCTGVTSPGYLQSTAHTVWMALGQVQGQ